MKLAMKEKYRIPKAKKSPVYHNKQDIASKDGADTVN